MRYAVLLLVVAAAVAEIAEEPWVEEDLEEPYDEYEHERQRRDAHDAGPYEEHVRIKRCEEPVYRERRSAEYVRTPRQVHQYEVHEFNEDSSFPSPPYEEMLAASAEHYHKYQAPPASRYQEVSPGHAQAYGFRPVSNVQVAPNVASHNPAPVRYQAVNPGQGFVSANPVNVASHASPVVNSYHNLPANVAPANSAPVKVAPVNAAPANVAPVNVGPIQEAAPAGLVALAPAPQPVKAIPDLTVAAGHQHNKHHRGHEHGGGHAHHGAHHAGRGGKSHKGYNSDHYVDKGGKGFKTDEHHRKEYEEAAGKKKKHHDHAGHKGSHEEEAHGHRGAKFDEKKGHKKGHKTKGYHNKYHKDEFHKEHKFYDDYHKSGEHHRYGKFNAKHASNESGKKKAHHVNAGHDYVERGKKGYSNKGHLDSDHKGHKGKSGHEEHHEKHSEHGKKGGKEGGSHWGYAKN